MVISGGGIATVVKENGGYVEVADGATVEFVSNTISGWSYSNELSVHSNTTILSSYIYGKLHLMGGVANSIKVGYDGEMHIHSGGIANSAVLSGASWWNGEYAEYAYAWAFVSSGGKAFDTQLQSYAFMNVYGGGIVERTVITGGGILTVFSGGSADNTTMGGGAMYISSGGSADNTVMNGGFCSMVISSGAWADNTVMNGDYCSMFISSGGLADHTTMSRGYMYVVSGGVADNTTMSGGRMVVYYGGCADNTVMNGGCMYLSSGASATGIVENGGYVEVGEGAVVEFASHTISGFELNTSMTVHSNTVAQDIAVSAAGKMYIYDGGIAENTVLQGSATSKYYNSWTYHYAEMYLSGGSARNTTVSSYAKLYISSGGVAENTIVNSSGFMYISSGGVVDNATIYSAGSVCIYSGGIADNLYVRSGGRVSLQGGTVRKLEFVGKQNVVWTDVDGSVENMIVNSNVFLKTSNATVGGIQVREMGAVYVSGGVVMQSEVDGWGILQLCSGAVASNTVVHTGGHCYIGSGAVVTGEFTVETGATVLAFTGSELNLNLEARSADSEALVNDLCSIVGNISYSITISADQEAGLYRLADNVLTFTNDVQLFWGEEVFEGFNVGETLECNGISLELILEDNSLMLEVSSPELYLNLDHGAGGLPDWTDPLAAGTDLESGGNTMNDPLKDGILA